MPQSRKALIKTYNAISSLKERNEYLKEALINLKPADEFNKLLSYYDGAMSKLAEMINALPIGYRYEGTFYIRKPYSIPIEFIRIEGAVFLREDLVKWTIENSGEEYDYSYFDKVYKSPSLNAELITKNDTQPVFAVFGIDVAFVKR